MATLNLKILPNRRKLSGKLGIYVSLTFKKEVRYISTEFEVDDEYQFENGKVWLPQGCGNHEQKNTVCAGYIPGTDGRSQSE